MLGLLEVVAGPEMRIPGHFLNGVDGKHQQPELLPAIVQFGHGEGAAEPLDPGANLVVVRLAVQLVVPLRLAQLGSAQHFVDPVDEARPMRRMAPEPIGMWRSGDMPCQVQKFPLAVCRVVNATASCSETVIRPQPPPRRRWTISAMAASAMASDPCLCERLPPGQTGGSSG